MPGLMHTTSVIQLKRTSSKSASQLSNDVNVLQQSPEAGLRGSGLISPSVSPCRCNSSYPGVRMKHTT